MGSVAESIGLETWIIETAKPHEIYEDKQQPVATATETESEPTSNETESCCTHPSKNACLPSAHQMMAALLQTPHRITEGQRLRSVLTLQEASRNGLPWGVGKAVRGLTNRNPSCRIAARCELAWDDLRLVQPVLCVVFAAEPVAQRHSNARRRRDHSKNLVR